MKARFQDILSIDTVRFKQLSIHKTLVVVFFGGLADMLSFCLSKIFRYRIKVIRKNLRTAFPEISQRKEKELIRSYYQHLSDLMVEPFMINSLNTREISGFVQYENLHVLNHQLRSGKDIVLLMSHYGNWEYLLTLPLITEYEVVAVYAPISNPFVDDMMKKLRSRFGVRLIAKSDWYRRVLTEKKEKPVIYLMIADQRPVRPFRNSVDFFGQKTFVQAGCERIARRLNCSVVYVSAEKTERHCYRYKFGILADGSGEEVLRPILKKYFAALELTIRSKPAFWLWSHDRWKYH